MRKAPIQKAGIRFELNRELVEDLRETVAEIKVACVNLGIDLDRIDAADTETFERIAGIDDAVDKLLINDATKRDYLQRASQIYNLYKAILPDPAANDFNGNLLAHQYHRTENQKLGAARGHLRRDGGD